MALLLLQCLLQRRGTVVDVIAISVSVSDSDSDFGFVSVVGHKQDVGKMQAMIESDHREQ